MEIKAGFYVTATGPQYDDYSSMFFENRPIYREVCDQVEGDCFPIIFQLTKAQALILNDIDEQLFCGLAEYTSEYQTVQDFIEGYWEDIDEDLEVIPTEEQFNVFKTVTYFE